MKQDCLPIGGVEYSSSERVIGSWFGKPLYQKTYVVTYQTVSTEGTYVATILDSDTTKRVKNYNGFYYNLPSREDNIRIIPNIFKATSSGDILQVKITQVDGVIRLDSNTFATNGCTAHVTVQYTKTTD